MQLVVTSRAKVLQKTSNACLIDQTLFKLNHLMVLVSTMRESVGNACAMLGLPTPSLELLLFEFAYIVMQCCLCCECLLILCFAKPFVKQHQWLFK